VTEKELGRALLQVNALQLAGTPDAVQQTWKVLERDRRRVRWLSWLTVGMWIVAAAMIFLLLVAFGLLLPLQAKLRADVQDPRLNAAERQELQTEVTLAFQKAGVFTTLAVAVLAAAALGTMLLLFASRRATLRQVNASLVEISAQLKQLRELSPRPPQ